MSIKFAAFTVSEKSIRFLVVSQEISSLFHHNSSSQGSSHPGRVMHTMTCRDHDDIIIISSWSSYYLSSYGELTIRVRAIEVILYVNLA